MIPVSLTPSDRPGHHDENGLLRSLCVAPDEQHNGIATQLVRELEAHAFDALLVFIPAQPLQHILQQTTRHPAWNRR